MQLYNGTPQRHSSRRYGIGENVSCVCSRYGGGKKFPECEIHTFAGIACRTVYCKKQRNIPESHKFKKPALLIIDEWLLYPLKETDARDLLEIVETRYKKASTVFCSQFDIPGWREKIGDPIMADAICDRIVHDSYTILIDCKESMRKRMGVKEED